MPALELLVILVLVLVNGFFAMAEMAVVASRKPRLQMMVEAGVPGAARALALAEDPGRFLSAVQIGITLTGIFAGVFGGATLAEPLGQFFDGFPAIAPYGEPVAFALVVFGITFSSLVFGELVPKRIALAAPERIAAFVAIPLSAVAAIARPAVTLLGATTTLILALLRVRTSDKDHVTEEEVKTVIAEGTESGSIDPIERTMIEGVLRLADRPVRSVMTPRPEVYWVDVDDDPDSIKAEIAACPWSRLVVTRGGVVDEPIGVVQKKDLLDALLNGRPFDIAAALQAPLFVPEGTSVLQTLELFKRTPLHVAFVVDEFGSFQGLVTLTDVLSGIAGELPEEHADEPGGVRARDDGSFMVDGRTRVDDLGAALGLKRLPEGDYQTAAGLVLAVLERIPSEGDRLVVEGWTVEVIDMDGRRVDKLMFSPPRAPMEVEGS